MTTHNMGKVFVDQGYAVYLPAISGFYTKQVNQFRKDPEYHPESRIPKGFELGLDGLDFLKAEESYYHYPFGLYSAGHARLELERAAEEEDMIHKRNRDDTMILGDSGGFQMATGVLKMDWANAKDPHDPAREKMCGEILTWLEGTSDWSMTLDVPAFAAVGKLSEKTGLTEFQDTLDISVLNLHYFMEHRTPGKTKFLNVVSGSSVDNGREWYSEVKKFSDPVSVEAMGYSKDRTLEGYAFAGIHMKNMYATLERFLNLIDDDLIKDKDWIHFLGLGRLDWACFLTSIQRQIRKHHNPNIILSFDAASPFVATAYGQCYNYNYCDSKKFLYSMAPAPDEKYFEGNSTPMAFNSPISNRLTMHDLCPLSKAHGIIDGNHDYTITQEQVEYLAENGINAEWVEDRTNRLGKVPRTSWDTLSYLLYMSHNVYKHVEAVQEANRVTDVEFQRKEPHWREYTKEKRSSKSFEVSLFVPREILYFRSFVEELFDPATEDPYALLNEFRTFLDHISFGGTNSNMYDTFFANDDGTPETNVDKFADINNDKLTQLENENG